MRKKEGVTRCRVSAGRTLMRQFDQLREAQGSKNRSDRVVEHRNNRGDYNAAGTVTLVYDHHKGSSSQWRWRRLRAAGKQSDSRPAIIDDLPA